MQPKSSSIIIMVASSSVSSANALVPASPSASLPRVLTLFALCCIFMSKEVLLPHINDRFPLAAAYYGMSATGVRDASTSDYPYLGWDLEILVITTVEIKEEKVQVEENYSWLTSHILKEITRSKRTISRQMRRLL